MNFTYAGLPETDLQICAHEMAHGITASLTLYRIAPQHYGELLLHINAKASVGSTFTKSVPAHIARKVNALSALGPIALMPTADISETLRKATYENTGVLSVADVSVLYDAETSKHERDTAILATLAYFTLFEKKLARVADELISVTHLDILAPLLVPREAAKDAIALSRILMLDQKLGQPLTRTLNATQKNKSPR